MFAWLQQEKIEAFFKEDYGLRFQNAEQWSMRSKLEDKYRHLNKDMNRLSSEYQKTLEYPGGGRFRILYDSSSHGSDTHYWIIEINETRGLVMNPMEYFYLRERTSFATTDLALLQSRASGQQEPGLTVAPVGISMTTLQEEQREALGKIRAAEAEMEQIKKGTHSAMAEVTMQMEEAQKAMEAKKRELNSLMEIQKADLEKLLTECNQKVFKLESLIFNIQSYLGETYEIYQLRQGVPAPPNTPLVIGQKLRFLDEDLPLLVGLYGGDLIHGDHRSFMDALKYSDMLVEYFTLSERSITCFRLSRHINMKLGHRAVAGEDRYRTYRHWIESIEGPYGNDAMGFIIQDGENLYLTMVDDADRLFVDDDLFLDIRGPEGTNSTNPRHALARRFMFSTIQGFIDSKKLMQFSEEANLFGMTSNIILSAATTRLQDTRFGQFKDLKVKLNAMTRQDDDVFVIDIANDPDRVWGHVPQKTNNHSAKGLTKINAVRYRNGEKATFVSVERDTWNDGASRVNFQIVPSEYINVTYLNSVWVNYFIVNKLVDTSSNGGHPFSLFVKDLLIIRDYLNKREEKELALIKKEYPEIDTVIDWPLRLTEWKLQQKVPVREITEYQAKRFAKALREKSVQSLDFLYNEGALPMIVTKERIDYASSMAETDRSNRRFIDDERRTHLFYCEEELENIEWSGHFSEKFRDRLVEINQKSYYRALEGIRELEKKFGVSLMYRVKALQNLLDVFGEVGDMMDTDFDASEIIKMLVEDDVHIRRHGLQQMVESDRFHYASRYAQAQERLTALSRWERWKADSTVWTAKIDIGEKYYEQIRKYKKDVNLPRLVDNATNIMVTAYLSIVDQLNSYPYTHLRTNDTV